MVPLPSGVAILSCFYQWKNSQALLYSMTTCHPRLTRIHEEQQGQDKMLSPLYSKQRWFHLYRDRKINLPQVPHPSWPLYIYWEIMLNVQWASTLDLYMKIMN
jgi:hypothetical protein